MFDWVLKTSLKASIEAFVSSTFFSFSSHLVKVFFFLLLCQFLFLPIFKNDVQVLFFKTFIFIQTNINRKTYTSMQMSRCLQDKTMVSDNFKRNLHHFNMKKLNMLKCFIWKWKRINTTFRLEQAITYSWVELIKIEVITDSVYARF